MTNRTVHAESLFDTKSPESAVGQQLSSEKTVSGALRLLAESYAQRPALAWRSGGGWVALSYVELVKRIRTVAAGLGARLDVRRGDRVAVLGFTSPEYAILDFALTGPAAAVSVPLQPGAPMANWRNIIEETDARVLAVSANQIDAAVGLLGTIDAPAQILVFDSPDGLDLTPGLRALATAAPSATVTALADLEADAATLPAPAETVEPSDLSLLIYTSGSTGTPKGAMYNQAAVARMIKAGFGVLPNADPHPWVTLNFMPMSHVMGRATLSQTLGNGGTAYFTARSDLSELLDDIAAVQPTDLHFVPRVWEMLYQEYLAEVNRGVDPEQARQALRQRCFGDKRVYPITGSAPTSAEVAEFVERLTETSLIEGYGSTEVGGVLINGQVVRPPVIDYKLVDVPELGYRTTDRPHPRGELLVKTDDIFDGYFARPELTAQVFDEQGYYRTGDIMAETGPDLLRYLDRRNNVIKLSQGEFVTVSRVEAVLATAPIRQIYVYGNSSRPYLLAVAVPTDDALTAADGDADALRARVLDAIRATADREGLSAAETPRDVIVETDPFTQANGLLTGIAKLARPQLRERYGVRLEDLYADLERDRAERLRTAAASVGARPTVATVIDVVTAMLDLVDGSVTPESKFTDLGGDSLTAVTLGTTLKDLFGVEVSVGLITSPTTDIAVLAAYLENPATAGRASVAAVHADPTVLNAAELTLDKFLPAELLSDAVDLPSAPETPNTVLLTGATGFLGRYLLLGWLREMERRRQVDGSIGTVISLIRADDERSGRARLDAVFDSGDEELQAEFTRLADAYLRVVPGDKDAHRLGLDDVTWHNLAATVDLIVDPAALVNHVLGYSELFGPNVVGTAELIGLALTTVKKPYVYTSTVGVGDQIPPAEFVEDTDIRVMSAVRRVDGSYANGYGNSKWAGEVLLADAHDRFGLPVTVFRCDMILADADDLGQLNLPDMFTRLLQSVAATGIAPRSFHPLDADGNPVAAHYDALPVDFLAAAITALSAPAGHRTFHAMNPHADGIGLDRFVDWMIDDGVQIRRIDDYDEWFAEFSAAVAALPERRRRHSLLPILHNYAHPSPGSVGGAAPAQRFHDAVMAAGVGAERDIPHISPAIIGNYVRSLRHLDLI